MEMKPYKTLIQRSEDAFIEKKSRFIGHGAPVETEEEALAFLAEMRTKYKDASHNCYAYIIGQNMGIMRYSDDGEPGGTAGMPIIEAMKAREITNSVIVVTRYFGGILLGTGGLTRAYAHGASIAMQACGIGVMTPTKRLLVEIPYTLLNKFEYMLKSEPVQVTDKTFGENVIFTILVRSTQEEEFTRDLTVFSDGKCEALTIDESYLSWSEE